MIRERGDNVFLFHKDRKLAEVQGELVVPASEEYERLLPLCFTIGGWSFRQWIESRAVDSSRVTSRMIKRAANCKDYSDYKSALHVGAVCLTDYFSIGESDPVDRGNLTDMLWNISLRGQGFNDLLNPVEYTTELTNTGSFDKCWRKHNDVWVNVKHGTVLQSESEVAVARLGRLLKFNTVWYQFAENWFDDVLGHEYVVSENFTDVGYDFEPIAYLVGEDIDLRKTVRMFKLLQDKEYLWGVTATDLFEQLFDILVLDAIAVNPDRHTFNYGVLRDMSTGDVVGLAPNYDNNLALFAQCVKSRLTRFMIDVLFEDLSKLLKWCLDTNTILLAELKEFLSGYALRDITLQNLKLSFSDLSVGNEMANVLYDNYRYFNESLSKFKANLNQGKSVRVRNDTLLSDNSKVDTKYFI